MKTVHLEVESLLAKVKENRAGHRDLYEKAMEGYKEQVTIWFYRQLEAIDKGEGYSTTFHLPRPEDHTDDYDTAIEMLEMSVDPTITLTFQEFQQYVRDQWGWRHTFMATASNYVEPNEL